MLSYLYLCALLTVFMLAGTPVIAAPFDEPIAPIVQVWIPSYP